MPGHLGDDPADAHSDTTGHLWTATSCLAALLDEFCDPRCDFLL